MTVYRYSPHILEASDNKMENILVEIITKSKLSCVSKEFVGLAHMMVLEDWWMAV
jgi:hypothetical protein